MKSKVKSSFSALCAVVIMAFGLAGCAGNNAGSSNAASNAPTEPNPSETPTSQLITIIEDQTKDSCMEALIDGVLKSDEQGCLVVSSEREENYDTIPVWPKGTKITSESVTLPDGTVLRVGEKVSLGGGFISKGSFFDQAKNKCHSESVYVVCGMQE